MRNQCSRILLLMFLAGSLLTCQSRMDPRYLSPGAPIVTSISPSTGIVGGGQVVTITGQNFRDGTGLTVALGGSNCVVSAVTPTQITCTTTKHASNAVDVVVTAGDTLETGTLSKGYGYKAYLYAATQTANTYGFAIDPFTGALTATPSSPYSNAASGTGYGINVHPSDQFVYTANVSGAAGAASVLGWSINQTDGSLTIIGTTSSNTPAGPDAITFTSDGKYMFVGGTGSPSTVSSYIVNSNGTLTSTGPTVTATGCNFASQMVVDPNNANLYMSCNGNGSGAGGSGLAAFAINSSTGAITFTSFTAGGSGDAIAIEQTGTYVYTGNTGGASGAVQCGVHGVYDTFGGLSVYLTNGGVPSYVQSCNHGDNSGTATRGSGCSVQQNNRWLITSARVSAKIEVWDISALSSPSLTTSLASVNIDTNDARFDKTGRFMYDSTSGNVEFYNFDLTSGTPTFNTAYSAAGTPGVSDVTY